MGTEYEWGYFTAKEGMTWEEFANDSNSHVSSTGYSMRFFTGAESVALQLLDPNGEELPVSNLATMGPLWGSVSWSAEIVADRNYGFD